MVDSTLRLLPLEGTNRIWNKKKRLLRMSGHSLAPRHPAVALNPGEGWQSKAARCFSAARSGFTSCLSRKAIPEMLRKEVLLAIPAAGWPSLPSRHHIHKLHPQLLWSKLVASDQMKLLPENTPGFWHMTVSHPRKGQNWTPSTPIAPYLPPYGASFNTELRTATRL